MSFFDRFRSRASRDAGPTVRESERTDVSSLAGVCEHPQRRRRLRGASYDGQFRDPAVGGP
ncbi:MAG: hypothetical protein V9G13_14485 [Marmoricola sp.]